MKNIQTAQMVAGTVADSAADSVTDSVPDNTLTEVSANRTASTDNYRPCVIIPHYNHARQLGGVLQRLADVVAASTEPAVQNLCCWVVDDGSEAVQREQLAAYAEQYPFMTIVQREQNGGKGAATITGFKTAAAEGYTHAVQVDADGQHRIEDIPKFFAYAEQQPEKVITGKPVYDHSIPAHRLYFRYITRFFVWVNTLSLAVIDPQCGFRAYPLARVLPIVQRHWIGRNMDYDIDIIVRLYWSGAQVVNLLTKVVYPEEGVSHFHMLKDNLRITRCHVMMFLGMLWRSPKLLMRHWRGTAKRVVVGEQDLHD